MIMSATLSYSDSLIETSGMALKQLLSIPRCLCEWGGRGGGGGGGKINRLDSLPPTPAPQHMEPNYIEHQRN